MLQLFSPAKINLNLRIISKRSDGYHALSSLIQTVSLGDILTIEPFHIDSLTCSDESLLMDSSNLVTKALTLFRKKTGMTRSFKIHLKKFIPMEAGLGGGSSNAATLLWGCNQFLDQKVSLDLLSKWGAELGSDVPFFFSQGTALCTGRGELVEDLSAFTSPPSLSIVKPPYGLPTSQIFRYLKLPVSSESVMIEGIGSKLFNDLEEPAFELKPELKQLKSTLLKGGFQAVLMSGSGSSLVCFGEGVISPNILGVCDCFSVNFLNRPLLEWYQESMI